MGMRNICIVAILFCAATGYGADFNVTLAASPAAQSALGSPVTLTATVNTKPLALPIKTTNYRYTFSAKPAGGSPVAFATNVATKSVTWHPPAAGTYELSVRAVEVEGRTPLDLRIAADATATLPNYNVFTTGPDLIPVNGPFLGECAITPDHPCEQCPMVTIPIYVKNIGNVNASGQVTVTVKYQTSVIATWTVAAPAWGQQVKAGSYTTFPWNCPAITSSGSVPNYFVTVDTTNVVHESNEQNNTIGFYLRFPDRTTFHTP